MLDFSVSLQSILLVFISAILSQTICEILFLKKNALQTDLKSPLITSLSLCLLLRADTSSFLNAWPLALAAMLGIFSKFTLRLQNKHIFNPANFGIVIAILLTDHAWTTPGQWGPMLWAGLFFIGVGFFVTYKAARADVPIVFLGTYAALLYGRALWLGDPLTIPTLNLQNGAILLFAFFMISDPKTTPDTHTGRIIFCSGTALVAYILQYHFYLTDGLFYALALTCCLRPILDKAANTAVYQWPTSPVFHTHNKGELHASTQNTVKISA